MIQSFLITYQVLFLFVDLPDPTQLLHNLTTKLEVRGSIYWWGR